MRKRLYLVEWKIDVEAKSPQEAAKKALEIQRDQKSPALVFEVNGREIDLNEQQGIGKKTSHA